jgi:hypothetical protein
MLEEVEACVSIAPSRQRKKKRGRLLYSTPKELNRSRMRRSNVVQCFTPEHVNTMRALDFQGTDLEEYCTSMCIMPNVEEEAKGDDADIVEESDDEVSPKLEVAFSILIKHASEFES